jgi:hypothetical protein
MKTAQSEPESGAELSMRPCHGINLKTGKRVGVRHRWNRAFGKKDGVKTTCQWCGAFYAELNPGPRSLLSTVWKKNHE